MPIIPLVLAVISAIAAIYAFYRMAKGDPAQRTRFLFIGIALVLFTGVFVVQIITSSS